MSKFKCEKCSVYLTLTSRSGHMKRSHGEPTDCPRCGRTFRCLEYMQRHLKSCSKVREHGQREEAKTVQQKLPQISLRIKKTKPRVSSLFTCLYCVSQYPKAATLCKHIKKKHVGCVCYFCNFCHQPYGKKIELSKHVSVAHKNEIKYDCPLCVMQFKSQYSLGAHKANHRKAMEKESKSDKRLNSTDKLKCEICHLNFEKDHHLVSHMLLSHETESAECDICTETFQNMHQLYNHRVIVHAIEDSDLSCKICDTRFISRSSLVVHLNSAHPNYISHECEVCFKTFTTRVDYLVHMFTNHTEKKWRRGRGYKPRKCKLCNKSISSSSNYWRHMRRMHGMAKSKSEPKIDSKKPLKSALSIKIYTCNVCKNAYKYSQSFKFHMTHIHNRCYRCKLILENKTKLFQHYKTHKIRMVLRCFLCRKMFDTAEELDEHLVNNHTKAMANLKQKVSGSQENDIKAMATLKRKVLETPKKFTKKQELRCKYNCKKCDYTANNPSEIKSHVYRHHTKKGCFICKKMFVNKSQHDMHMNKVHNVDVNKFKCRICHLTYVNKRNLKHHVMSAHQIEEANSEISGKRYVNNDKSFGRDDDRDQEVECRICSKLVKNVRGGLKNHLRLIHGKTFEKYEEKTPTFDRDKSQKTANSVRIIDDENQIQCKLCPKMVRKSHGAIRNHVRTVHGMTYEEYVKTTRKVVDENDAERNSVGESNIASDTINAQDLGDQNCVVCTICSRVVKKASGGLKKHLIRIHRMTYEEYLSNKSNGDENSRQIIVPTMEAAEGFDGQNGTQCKLCSRKLSSAVGAIHHHLRRSHGMTHQQYLKKTSNSKVFKCEQCDFFSINLRSFARHATLHKKGVKCKKCEKSFSCQLAFYKHSKDIHNRSIIYYECHICNAFIPQIRKLKEHISRAHGIDDEKCLKCRMCRKRFNDKTEYIDHIVSKHKMNMQNYVDRLVESAENRRSQYPNIKNRKMAVKCTRKLDFKCSLCDYTTQMNKLYRLHMNNTHSIFEYTCHLCSKTYERIWSLVRHFRGTHGVVGAVKSTILSTTRTARNDFKRNTKRQQQPLQSTKKFEFKCNVCDYITHFRNLYVKHMNFKHNIFRYTCHLCSKTYETVWSLLRHFKTNHFGAKSEFKCNKCDFTTENHTLYAKHLNSTHGIFKYSCHLCSKTYDSVQSLLCHSKEKHSVVSADVSTSTYDVNEVKLNDVKEANLKPANAAVSRSYECKECKCKFSSSGLKNHITSSHRPFKCQKCSTICKNKANYMEHLKKVHKVCVGLYPCKICKMIYNHQSGLYKHIRIHHAHISATKPTKNKEEMVGKPSKLATATRLARNMYECKECECNFSPNGYHLHVKFSHRPIQCPKCSKICKNRTIYTEHLIQVHKASVKLYACKMCKVKYMQQRSLRRHIDNYHTNSIATNKTENREDVDVKPSKLAAITRIARDEYECRDCECKFDSRGLQAHIRRTHKPVQCKKCSTVCKNRDAYIKHLKKAHKVCVNLYPCTMCKIKYTRKDGLMIHIRKSHGNIYGSRKAEMEGDNEELHKCDICSRSYLQENDLKSHIMKIHKIKTERFDCQKCENSYKWLQTLRNHMKEVHKEELDFVKIPPENMRSGERKRDVKSPVKTKRICTFCDVEFDSFDTLKDHMFNAHNCKIQLKHEAENCIFKCFICLKTFDNQITLKMHLTEVHMIRLSPEMDQNTSLNLPSTSKFRLAESNGCNICGEVIANNLYHHMKHKHGLFDDDDDKSASVDHTGAIECQFCSIVLESSKTYKHHLRNIHGTSRLSACPTCGRQFLYGDGYMIESACLPWCKTFRSELVMSRCDESDTPRSRSEQSEPNLPEHDDSHPTITIDRVLSLKQEPLDESFQDIFSLNYYDNVIVKSEDNVNWM